VRSSGGEGFRSRVAQRKMVCNCTDCLSSASVVVDSCAIGGGICNGGPTNGRLPAMPVVPAAKSSFRVTQGKVVIRS
jgi:hypothetical protein